MKINYLSLFLTVALWNIPLMFPGTYFDLDAIAELLIIEAAVVSIFAFIAYRLNIMQRLLFILSLLSLFVVIVLALSGDISRIPFYLLSALIALRYSFDGAKRIDFAVGTAAFLILLLLLAISTSLRFLPAHGGNIYIFSIYDNTPPTGVPFTYSLGLVLSGGDATLTISPIISFLFPTIAYLAASNTFLILRRSSGLTVTSTAAAALACQCENTIGILSGTASYLVVAFLPFISFLSVALLLATNTYLYHPRSLRTIKLSPTISLIILLALIALESYFVASGLILILWIFGLNSLITILTGIFIGCLIPLRRRIPLAILIIAFAFQLFLFIPQSIERALSSPLFFEIYAILGLLSGLVISLSMKNRLTLSRIGIVELVFSMEAMISIAFLYLSLYSISIFSGFPGVAVLSFSISLLLVSVPVMWASNLFLLSAGFSGR